MAFTIKNPETDRLARRLAARKKVGLTKAVHEALQNELERLEGKVSLADKNFGLTRQPRAEVD